MKTTLTGVSGQIAELGKKILSILIALTMVISWFAIVPTVSAAAPTVPTLFSPAEGENTAGNQSPKEDFYYAMFNNPSEEWNPHGFKPLVCSYCSEEFYITIEIDAHIAEAHPDIVSEYYCSFRDEDGTVCGEKFSSLETLKGHWADAHDAYRLEREGKITLENILPPEFVVNYIVPPELLEPPEGFENFEFPSVDKLPYLVPPWLDPEENHWVPPENTPFYTWELDNIAPGAEIDIYIAENEPPQINKGGGDWVSAENVVENVQVGGICIRTENVVIPENVLDNVVTTIYNLDNLPADIPVAPDENFVEFFQIGTNIPDYVENAEIGFMVDKDWIDANDIDNTTLSLEHYVDGAWVETTPTIIGDDENYIYCTVENVPSFSVFAVTGKNAAAAEQEEVVTPPVEGIPLAAVLAILGAALAAAASASWIYLQRTRGEATSKLIEYGLSSMSIQDADIFRKIRTHKEFTIPELMRETGASKTVAWYTVQKLIKKGLVRPTGKVKLPPAGRGKPSMVFKYVGD